jgi:ribosomal protein S12 methylthiotransferase accessory factor
MDWAHAFRLGDGSPRLLPADVAFYGYEYQHRLEYHAGRRDRNRQRRVHFFAESSSGSALGSSLEEAALHGLVELIERDAFLMAWCRQAPLPSITPRSLADPTSRMLIDAIESRGFDVHLLATTTDLSLPTVWALAVNRSPSAIPATYSAAGASPVPGEAVRAALWELAQLVAQPVDWDVEDVQRLVDDPSLVDSIDDHVRLYTMPARRDRVTRVLGGPSVALADAFGDWPDALCRAAGGDVLGALRYLLDCCRGAGMNDAFVVDCSTIEHLDLGLRVARVVVPGVLPMCFGSPQQRLSGLARRERALAELGQSQATVDANLLLDPHPFP